MNQIALAHTFSFSQRSLGNLVGVHPDLVRVAHAALAISPIDFGIINGVRTCLRQHELFKEGASELDCPPPPGKLMGRHITGHAIDFDAWVNGQVTWDQRYYAQIGAVLKEAAAGLGIAVSWGGDWTHFKDWGHIELDRVAYPDEPLIA